jgi:hypothetical protein
MLAVPPYALLLFALAVPLPVPLDLPAALLSGGSLEVFTVCWATTMRRKYRPGNSPAPPPATPSAASP